MPQVARIGPKRKSKVGISAMHPAGAGDGLKRAKHERNKGSTASLASLGGGTTTSSEAARSRKASGRDRARLAVQEPAEDDWVSASGGESASQTPNTSGPSSPLPRAPPIERQQSQNYGVTPVRAILSHFDVHLTKVVDCARHAKRYARAIGDAQGALVRRC
jgi:hypothetical protein